MTDNDALQDDWRPFDRAGWVHARQSEEESEGTLDLPAKTTKRELTEARRKSNNQDRQTRGNRQDWRQYMRPLPKGYRLVPEETLTKQQKAARSKSIKAALEKREKRIPQIDTRREGGSRRDWREEQRREQMRLLVYFPDETHSGAYPWEPELRRLEEWFMLTIGGDTFEVRLEVDQSRDRWEMDGLTFYAAGKFPKYSGPSVVKFGPTGLAPDRTFNGDG